MENIRKKQYSYNKGENNPRWKGGTNSYYKDHHQLKLNRKEKLKQVDNKCEICNVSGEDTMLIATSKDGNKNNHYISNLIMKCRKCCGSPKLTKFKKKFGMTLIEMINKYNVPQGKIYNHIIPKCKNKREITKMLKTEEKKDTELY